MLPSAIAVEGNIASTIETIINNNDTTEHEPTLFIWTVRWIWKLLAALGLGFILLYILTQMGVNTSAL
jgi:hypothetical protein